MNSRKRYEAVPGKKLRLAEMETASTGSYAGKQGTRAELRRLKKQIAEILLGAMREMDSRYPKVSVSKSTLQRGA